MLTEPTRAIDRLALLNEERRLAREAKVPAMAADAGPRRREREARPVRPNEGIRALYRRRLDEMLRAMHADADRAIRAAWRSDEPAKPLAQDSAAATLEEALRRLSDRWTAAFDDLARRLAEHFATDAQRRSDAQLRRIFRDAGWTVRFAATPAQLDVLRATVNANVSLIKSIPQQYLKDVSGAVMRSVQEGRNLSSLTRALTETYGVARRRAAFIALDQNNKASTAFARTRQLELGVTEGVWQHSHAGEVPRPSHLRNDGKRFSLKDGWYDPDEGERIWPGQLPNCRCTWRPVLPGFG